MDFKFTRYRLAVTVTLAMCSSQVLFAQDATFSQYYASGLYLNPAMAGAENTLTFSSNFRTQWRSVTIPYNTNQFSFIYPLVADKIRNPQKGGVGISMYNDRAGDGNLKTMGVTASFAYNLPLNYNSMHTLCVGVQGGMMQRSIDFTNLEWGSQYNPYIGVDQTVSVNEAQIGNRALYPDASVGMIYYFNPAKRFRKSKYSHYLGAAAYHVNMPNESMVDGITSRLPMLFKLHGGLAYSFTEKVSLSPNFLAMMQNQNMQINTGLYVSYLMFDLRDGLLQQTNVILGTWYRVEDSFIISTGLSNDFYTLGFSFDYNSSSLRTTSGGRGAYEVSLTLRKPAPRKTKRFATPRI